MSHANISVFVPHSGCPNRCSFCDQVSISGTGKQPKAKDVDQAVKLAMSSTRYNPENTELAFFGGSFTAINREYMLELLSAAFVHVKNKNICGIRISTRPDCIDAEVLDILKKHGVTAIELGAQSMCDEVLTENNRGHTAEAVRNASRLIKASGFELGLQMMTGLYKSDYCRDVYTANEIVKLAPDTVRIYPAITLKNTMLEALYFDGEYMPPSLDETIDLCVELIEMFNKHGIKVIRTGLHSIDNKNYIAGPWHPAFRELCDSRVYLNKLCSMLTEKGDYTIFAAPKEISKVIGNKKYNLNKLKSLGYKCTVVADESVAVSDIRVERMNNSCF